VACGFFGFVRRKYFGAIIVAVTVLLLPMLHIIPVNFDESLYHDRYAMAPLALIAALAPGALADTMAVRYRAGLVLALCVWLAVALVNIRVSLPLWSSNIGLWQWALQSNPTSVTARENLLAAYITANDPRAREMSRTLISDPVPCFTCLLNIAYFAMSVHDTPLASAALVRLAADGSVTRDASLRQAYDVASGRLLEMTGNIADAEQAYRAAIALDSREPVTQMLLATLLARTGRATEAKSVAERGLALLPPDERDTQRREFEGVLNAIDHELPK
jgi:tetratricopeptide (TPR) repeat protein